MAIEIIIQLVKLQQINEMNSSEGKYPLLITIDAITGVNEVEQLKRYERLNNFIL